MALEVACSPVLLQQLTSQSPCLHESASQSPCMQEGGPCACSPTLDPHAITPNSSLVVCFGEMLIDFVPTVAGVALAEAPTFKKAAGGAPANVAVGIARLGGRSAFVGKVGTDEFGHMLADILRDNGVDNSGVVFDAPSGARTALAFVTLRADGEREFMFFRNPSADMMLQERELDAGLIKRASIFHYGSISLIAEPCRSAHRAAMRMAREAGALLSYDPNLRLPLWETKEAARRGIMSIWEEADMVKVSEDEVDFLTRGQEMRMHAGDDAVVFEGDHVDQGALKLMHPGLKLLLVTEGKDGCRYYTQTFKGKVKGLKVKTVDTTGAGDAFVGGMLAQLAKEGLSLLGDEGRLRCALHFANACGAIATTERGAIPALPNTQAVLDLLSTSSFN